MKIHKVSFYTYSTGKSLMIPKSRDNVHEWGFIDIAGVVFKSIFLDSPQSREEDQSMPPQSMALWHENHFELKASDKQQVWEKLSSLSSSFPYQENNNRYHQQQKADNDVGLHKAYWTAPIFH